MEWLLKFIKGEITFDEFLIGDPKMRLIEHNFEIDIKYSIDETRKFLKRECCGDKYDRFK